MKTLQKKLRAVALALPFFGGLVGTISAQSESQETLLQQESALIAELIEPDSKELNVTQTQESIEEEVYYVQGSDLIAGFDLETFFASLSTNYIPVTLGPDRPRELSLTGVVYPFLYTLTDDIDIVIELIGPPTRFEVFEKERRFGIWTNKKVAETDWVPSFYHQYFSREEFSVSENYEAGISYHYPLVNNGVFQKLSGVSPQYARIVLFEEMEKEGLFKQDQNVSLQTNGGFLSRINLGRNFPLGYYDVVVSLYYEGRLIERQVFIFKTELVGHGARLKQRAQQNSLRYALFAIGGFLCLGVFVFLFQTMINSRRT